MIPIQGRAVIFDMDGVIADSETWNMKAMLEILRQQDVIRNEAWLSRFSGYTHYHIWESLKEQFQLTDCVEEYVKRYFRLRDRMVEENGGIKPMPGAAELIRGLYQNQTTLAVASGSTPENIETYLTAFGIRDCFSAVVSGCECRKGKPDPEIYLKTAEKINYKPSSCIVIEDSVNGMKAAKAAGMYCVGYAPPESAAQDFRFADIIIDDFRTWIEQNPNKEKQS